MSSDRRASSTSIRRSCRRPATLARQAGQPIVDLAQTHTTVSVERAALRLAGLDGADADGMPWVNRLVDAVARDVGLEHGVALPVWDALRRAARPPDLRDPGRRRPAPARSRSACPTGADAAAARERPPRAGRRPGINRIDARRARARADDRAASATPPRRRGST